MEFYQPDNLEAIYGVGNPEAYNQGRQQVDMSNMFQDQQLQQQQAATQKAGLANLYDQQANPERLRKLQLDNEQTGYENMTKGVAGRQAMAMEGINLDAAKRKAILQASDDDIKSMQQQAQQMLYSLDPAVQEKGRKLTLLSQASVEARQKHAEDMEKQAADLKNRAAIAAGNNATTLGAARIGAQSRLDVAGMRQQAAAKGKSIQDQVAAGKLNFEKAATAFSTLAMFEEDPDIKQRYEAAAQQYEEANQRARAAGAIGKADPAALGIETAKPQTTLGNKPKLGTAENPIVLK